MSTPDLDWIARELDRYVIGPALGGRAPYDTPMARTVLAAIALYESGGWARFQRGSSGRPIYGLARGLWQFELAGVIGIARHAGALAVLGDLDPELPDRVTADVDGTWRRLAWDDPLACRLARALLWTVPRPLPSPDDDPAIQMAEAAAQYREAWRPGRWRPARWRIAWTSAHAALLPAHPTEATA